MRNTIHVDNVIYAINFKRLPYAYILPHSGKSMRKICERVIYLSPYHTFRRPAGTTHEPILQHKESIPFVALILSCHYVHTLSSLLPLYCRAWKSFRLPWLLLSSSRWGRITITLSLSLLRFPRPSWYKYKALPFPISSSSTHFLSFSSNLSFRSFLVGNIPWNGKRYSLFPDSLFYK